MWRFRGYRWRRGIGCRFCFGRLAADCIRAAVAPFGHVGVVHGFGNARSFAVFDDLFDRLFENLNRAEFCQQFVQGLMPLLGLLGEHFQDQTIHFRRDIGVQRRRIRWCIRDVLFEQIIGRQPLERRPSHEDFKQRDAEIVDVRVGSESPGPNLFGGHVGARPLHQFGFPAEESGQTGNGLFGQRKVDNPHFAAFAAQNVVGLDIAVQPAFFVNVGQRHRDLLDETLQADLETEQIALNLRFQTRGLEQFHQQVAVLLIHRQATKPYDIRMFERFEDFGLGFERISLRGIFESVG